MGWAGRRGVALSTPVADAEKGSPLAKEGCVVLLDANGAPPNWMLESA